MTPDRTSYLEGKVLSTSFSLTSMSKHEWLSTSSHSLYLIFSSIHICLCTCAIFCYHITVSPLDCTLDIQQKHPYMSTDG